MPIFVETPGHRGDTRLFSPWRSTWDKKSWTGSSPEISRPKPATDPSVDRRMIASSRYATYFHVHLVSDSTGETLNAMARAVCARFENVLPIEHYYALVRSPRQLERALADIEEAPGVVMHTIVDDTLRTALEEGCRRLDMPCIAALDPLVSALSRYLGAALTRRVGAQHALDTDYFNRMDALNYAIGHDDGQGGEELDQADVVLVGVSRTSKTPTCGFARPADPDPAQSPPVPQGVAGHRLHRHRGRPRGGGPGPPPL